MMRWLRKHRYIIFLITIAGFLIGGSLMGFGSYLFTRSPYDTAIVVNGEKIPYKRYQTRFRQYVQNENSRSETSADAERVTQLKRQAVQDLIRETVFLQEAEKYGVVATDNEVAAYIQSQKAFQVDGKFDQGRYLQVVHQVLRIPADEFEKERRNELQVQKLQALMASGIKISNLEFNWAYQKKMATTQDPEERKKLQESPKEFREQLRQEQVNHAFQEWLGQVNNQLKVKLYLDRWENQQTS